MKAFLIGKHTVIDPDTKGEIQIEIYKEEGGGCFGVDSSYIEDEDNEVHSPFGNGILTIIE